MEKLKGKGLVEKEGGGNVDDAAAHAHESHNEVVPGHALQLPVDVYQSDYDIIIFAQLAGIDIETLDVSITGENDVVSIQGRSVRPEHLMGENAHQHGEFTLEECSWGDFYRQIILPEEIDPENAEAKTRDGVLMLRLPLIGKQGKGLRLNVVRLEDHHH